MRASVLLALLLLPSAAVASVAIDPLRELPGVSIQLADEWQAQVVTPVDRPWPTAEPHDDAFHLLNGAALIADAVDSTVTAYYVGAGKGREGNPWLRGINSGKLPEFLVKKLGLEGANALLRYVVHKRGHRKLARVLAYVDIALKAYAISTWRGVR